ncbi:copper chaperone PCu(A)C [Aestuariivirga sp.]|jgi:copper(I)-binding protein|uniref:copper chaperone PCu(A)C n=1 Tax=Aestuariivirga sp. TaxID=2650926 RepID=UPI00378486C0
MKHLKDIAFAVLLTLAAVLAAPWAGAHDTAIKAGNLVITGPWSRQSPMAADVAAGFLTIANTGQEDDRLVKAETAISSMTQIHGMKMEGDVMKMFELPEGIPIPAGGTVELKPKSLHLMFMGLAKPPAEGEHFTATLTFEKAGTVEVQFDVLAPGAHMN